MLCIFSLHIMTTYRKHVAVSPTIIYYQVKRNYSTVLFLLLVRVESVSQSVGVVWGLLVPVRTPTGTCTYVGGKSEASAEAK
jgi:hypothetical protein